MTLDTHWPTTPNPDRADRKAYYDEQKRLRLLERKQALSRFDIAAWCEFAERIARPDLSIDKEIT